MSPETIKILVTTLSRYQDHYDYYKKEVEQARENFTQASKIYTEKSNNLDKYNLEIEALKKDLEIYAQNNSVINSDDESSSS